MKRILLAGTALVIAGQAHAAGVGYSWTGCSVGGHVGIGHSKTDISEPQEQFFQFLAPVGQSIGVSDTGVLGGVQVGCDYQFAQNWLVGVGGDFSWTDIAGQTSDPFFSGKSGGPLLLAAKTHWLASATGRIGYAWDRWLLYAKGGAAWARNRYDVQNSAFWGAGNTIAPCFNGVTFVGCNPSGSQTRFGWTIGVGVEWAFIDNWTAGIEYAHYDFGHDSVILTESTNAAPPLSAPINFKQTVDVVKLNVNYRFAPWGGH